MQETRPGISPFIRALVRYNLEEGRYPVTRGIGRWEAIRFKRDVEQKLELKRTKMVDSQRAEALDQVLMTVTKRP